MAQVKTRIRRRITGPVLAALHHSGLDRAWAALKGATGATILMYHSVTDAQNRPWIAPQGSVTEEVFTAHIAFLARHRRPMALSALTDMIARGETPPRDAVVVTFDDGYLDTLRLAGPILTRHGVPAAVFAVSDWVGQGAPWVDRLHSAILRRRADSMVLDGETLSVATPAEASVAFARASNWMLNARPEVRDETLDAMIAALDPDALPPRLLMTWEELALWLEQGPDFEVGVHTRRHPDMRIMSDEEIGLEVGHCADALNERLGVRHPHFAYPYGRADARTREALRASRCRSALEGGMPARVSGGDDPFALRRTNGAGSLARLGVITSGAWPDLPRALRLDLDG